MDEFQQTSADRFCSKYAFRLPVGENVTLIYWAPDRSAVIVPNHVATLLDHCRVLRTLDEHTSFCAQAFARSSRGSVPTHDSIRAHLATLAGSGLLISEKVALETCRHHQSQPPPKIASLGVITRNRTDSLERCLGSFIENSRKYERTNSFIVMDDSDDPATRIRNKEVSSRLKQNYDVDILYAGREEKMLFANALLSEGGFDREIVNFALFDSDGYEFSCGKNRNALFLDTIGDLIFSSDDDSVCRIVGPPYTDGDREQIPRGQPLTPVEFWFFPSREEAINAIALCDEDLIESHEKLLGKQIADCVTDFGE